MTGGGYNETGWINKTKSIERVARTHKFFSLFHSFVKNKKFSHEYFLPVLIIISLINRYRYRERPMESMVSEWKIIEHSNKRFTANWSNPLI